MKKHIYWHVFITDISIKIKPLKTKECKEAGSDAAFTKKEYAQRWANSKNLKN